MASRKEAARPPRGHPLPRRLFSIDSLRKEKSGSDSDTASVAGKDTTKRTRVPSGASSTGGQPSVQMTTSTDTEDSGGEKVLQWMDGQTVRSPDELKEQSPAGDEKLRHRLHIQRPVPLRLGADTRALSGDEAPLPSPGKRRWDTLRAHVLPNSANSVNAPQPYTRPGTPSSAGASPPPSRPSTPKSYRFGQKIFRQVVEQAREVAVDEHRKFADSILKACWAARFGESSTRPRPEREGSQATVASTLHIPFMASAASLPNPGSHSFPSINVMRRQGSSQTVAVDSRTPSVAMIQQALTFSMVMNRPAALPHETHVLSALLVPFLGPYRSEQVSFEQQTAVETFEYLIRTWKAPSNEVDLDRCIWCCNAASVPSGSRMRILGALSSLLFSRERTLSADTPLVLRALFQAMFSLLMCLSSTSSQAEVESLRAYIAAIRDGQCGTPSPQSLEKEYGVRWSRNDNDQDVRRLIAIEGLIGQLEIGSESSRKWMLRNLVEEFWPSYTAQMTLTSLQSCIHAHKLKTFVTTASNLLCTASSGLLTDASVISRIFQTRILSEVDSIHDKDIAGARPAVLRLALNLTCVREFDGRSLIMEQIGSWLQDTTGWKLTVEDALNDMIVNAGWPTLLRLLQPVSHDYPENVRAPLTLILLPLLHDRLMANTPEDPCQPLINFLDSISRMYPKLFYKPIFTCAASGKDLTIANHICVLSCLSHYLTDFWCRDADMMSVALMSDAAGAKPPTQPTGTVWGRERIGQSVLILELINHLRNVRQTRDVMLTASATRFAVSLEARLGALIQAKEQKGRIPRFQRRLFCALFREIRLITRSLKPAPWLATMITWILDESTVELESGGDEIVTSFNKLQALYTHAQEAFRGGSKVCKDNSVRVACNRRPTLKVSGRPSRWRNCDRDNDAPGVFASASYFHSVPAVGACFWLTQPG